MKKFYISFGQIHSHCIGRKTFDRDCIGVIEAEDYSSARKIAFKIFKKEWCFIYENLSEVQIEFYPRGLINVN